MSSNIPIQIVEWMPEGKALLVPPLLPEDLVQAGINDDEPLIRDIKIETERSEGKTTYKLTALFNEEKFTKIAEIIGRRSVSLSIPIVQE